MVCEGEASEREEEKDLSSLCCEILVVEWSLKRARNQKADSICEEW